MKIKSTLFSLLLVLAFLIVPIKSSWAGSSDDMDVLETDSAAEDSVIGFFDLRDRETFIQVTNVNSDNAVGENLHIQIFNVGDLCNENNFFDFYTPDDTHVYNLRDITRNDGTPNTVVLPGDAYGWFVANAADDNDPILIGNQRIIDNSGYEYRTNLVGWDQSPGIAGDDDVGIFHFNTESGVTLSDIVGFQSEDDPTALNQLTFTNIIDNWTNWDVDIVDLNEDVSSCRSVAFTCADQDHPLLPEMLNEVEDKASENAATVASFEYGINNAIPHSRGAPLLCPGNITSEGYVRLELDDKGSDTENEITIFVGLNNGNGRGSMDVLITETSVADLSPQPNPR